MNEKIQELLNKLSYCFATPEAETFNSYINNNKISKAKKMLLEYITEEEADLVIKSLKKETEKLFKLIPITYEKFIKEYPYSEDIPDIKLIVNHKGHISNGILFGPPRLNSNKNEWYIYTNNDCIRLKNVSQIWIQILDFITDTPH